MGDRGAAPAITVACGWRTTRRDDHRDDIGDARQHHVRDVGARPPADPVDAEHLDGTDTMHGGRCGEQRAVQIIDGARCIGSRAEAVQGDLHDGLIVAHPAPNRAGDESAGAQTGQFVRGIRLEERGVVDIEVVDTSGDVARQTHVIVAEQE